MNRSIIILGIILVLASLGYVFVFGQNDSKTSERIDASSITSMRINEHIFDVEVASTHEERMQGLSGRASLPVDTGLLFIFDEPGNHGIWMKEMLFSIDILWIDERMNIIHIEESVSPETFPESFKPGDDALFVLETNEGFVDSYSISIGDTVEIF